MTTGTRTPAEELRHCVYALVGQLDAVCSNMPECPEAFVLRAIIEGGMPEMTRLADEVTGETEPPAKAWERGWQVSLLQIREERTGERLPREVWHQDPVEFLFGLSDDDAPPLTRMVRANQRALAAAAAKGDVE
jgi:hypothetical protein